MLRGPTPPKGSGDVSQKVSSEFNREDCWSLCKEQYSRFLSPRCTLWILLVNTR